MSVAVRPVVRARIASRAPRGSCRLDGEQAPRRPPRRRRLASPTGAARPDAPRELSVEPPRPRARAPPWFDELAEFLRIPSVSADPAHDADDVRGGRAGCATSSRRGRRAAEVVDWDGQPLAIGEIRASTGRGARRPSSATAISTCSRRRRSSSGRATRSSPRSATSYLYGRGTVDDKGQLYMLLSAARELARARRAARQRPLLLRRRGGDRRPLDRRLPRGRRARRGRGDHLRQRHDPARTARLQPRDARARLLPRDRADRRARPPLRHLRRRRAQRGARARRRRSRGSSRATAGSPSRSGAGLVPPTDEELRGWAELPPGADELAAQGARPMDPRAAEEFYLRTFAEPALDVNGFESGSPHLQKTVLPVEAVANLSIRLAPGQKVEEIAPRGRAAAARGRPGGRDARDRALVVVAARPRLARREGDPARPRRLRAGPRRAAGADPERRHPADRAGARRQDPDVITGFGLPDSNIHSPNERLSPRTCRSGSRRARAVPRVRRADP